MGALLNEGESMTPTKPAGCAMQLIGYPLVALGGLGTITSLFQGWPGILSVLLTIPAFMLGYWLANKGREPALRK